MNLSPSANPPDLPGDEKLIFAAEAEVAASVALPVWKVMIADDEEGVHAVTKLIFEHFSFMGRRIQFVDAYSGQQACSLLEQHPDTAVIFMDVVMESEHAGLDAVKRIRDEMGNTMVRIILRTGQPGQAPEPKVVVDYDINDYKSKTELTSQKLHTTLVAALRSFQDLKAMDSNRRGLLKILEASNHFDLESLHIFVSGLLMQLAILLGVNEDDLVFVRQQEEDKLLKIMASSGNYEPFIGSPAIDVLSREICQTMQEAIFRQADQIKPDYGVYLIADKTQGNVLVYVNGEKSLGQVDLALVKVFCDKVLLAYENVNLIAGSQSDLDVGVSILAEITNPSYADATGHAKLVGMLSRDIAERLAGQEGGGVSRHMCKKIGRAAMLCDIGNHFLPATIWQNTGMLSKEEWAWVRTHPDKGAILFARNMPESNESGAAALAYTIILTHHERYDGSGYPSGVLGKEIPLAGRIVAVTDAFIAMTSPRPHRDAISHEEAVRIIAAGSGNLFDPDVVHAFLAVADNYRQGG